MIQRSLFSSEHQRFRGVVRRFIAAEIEPHYAQWEAAGQVPRDVWRQAGRAGILCCNVPRQYGGKGGDFLHSAVVIEEFSRAGVMGPLFSLQSDVVAPYLVDFGTDAQKRHWLPRLASGETVVAFGMSEPDGGSDLQAIRTSAIRQGDDYVINGQKVFITHGHTADLLVLACKTDPGAKAKGVSLILVETSRPGFQRGRRLDKIGCKAQDTAELFFSDLRLPRSNLLGEEGGGFAMLMAQLSQERLIMAIRAVAASEVALEQTIEHVSQRDSVGQVSADCQNTRFELAALHAKVLTQRVFIDRCLELHSSKQLDPIDAAVAKMIATETQGEVADRCLQLFGGSASLWALPIVRAFADARMSRLGGGATEVMKQIIGRSVLTGAHRGSTARLERKEAA